MPRNWEEHYTAAANRDETPAPLLVQAVELLPPGRALDLACGAGRNALYLAGLGWDVVAVDSAAAAIRIIRVQAAERGLAVDARVAGLETDAFTIEPGGYDLICDFFYLQRELFPYIREGVKSGGVFVAEIHLRDQNCHRFVLEPGELRAEFAGWKVLYYSETVRRENDRPTAQMIARRA